MKNDKCLQVGINSWATAISVSVLSEWWIGGKSWGGEDCWKLNAPTPKKMHTENNRKRGKKSSSQEVTGVINFKVLQDQWQYQTSC